MLDEYLEHILGLINEHGWAVQHVGGGDLPGEVPFSYTVGLTAFGHPEFVLQGMPHLPAQRLLNILGSEVRNGHRYREDSLTSDPTAIGAPVALISVLDTSELAVAIQLYGEVEALQVIWPDSKGRLPWDNGYANSPDIQPFMGIVPERFGPVDGSR
jgi:Domain of unknown function (DUF4262)